MKKNLTNPLVIISFFLILATIFVFSYFYFVKPFIIITKEEVQETEKKDLELLTTAYLNQNRDINIKKVFFGVSLNEYKVASEYYYLKNGKNSLDKYEDILEVAKNIFNNKGIIFSNFIINLDKCGKEKYSTIEGYIYNDTCDLNNVVFEINDIYKIEDSYVVEFYASIANQILIENEYQCETGQSFVYNLQLKSLENDKFLDQNYAKCLNDFNYGIFYLKNEILEKIKSNNYKYKMVFKKNNTYFTFYDLKK